VCNTFCKKCQCKEINKQVVELLDTFEERIYTNIDSTENCG